MNNCTRRTAMQQIIGLNACVEVKTEETPKQTDAEEGMMRATERLLPSGVSRECSSMCHFDGARCQALHETQVEVVVDEQDRNEPGQGPRTVGSESAWADGSGSWDDACGVRDWSVQTIHPERPCPASWLVLLEVC